jgi:hypothetical protein
MKKNLILFVFATFLALVYGCGSSPSPSQVVKNFYDFGNKGEYSKAENCFSKELLNSVKIFNGTKTFIDMRTKKGTVKECKVLTEKIRGEGATVSIEVDFVDGTSQKDDIEMIKEDGVWKIALKG